MAKQSLKCKIVNIERDPRAPGRSIVSIKIDDGDQEKEPYVKGYSIINDPEHPPSLEMFMEEILARHNSGDIKLDREDPMKFLREEQESATEFTINLAKPKESSDGKS